MPNNLIPTPIGLPAIVNKLQVALYEPLKAKWNNTQLDGYPICYSKTKDGKRTIEYFEGGIDSKNLIYAEDNKFWFTSYYRFYQLENSISNYKTKLDLYFTVNLNEVKSEITTHRADYETRSDVLEILQTIPEIKVSEVIVGVEDVYRGIDYVYQSYEQRQSDDLQPYHCFRIVLDVLDFTNDLVLC